MDSNLIYKMYTIGMREIMVEQTLEARVDAFKMMTLPGQPQEMHMGTYRLVHDLEWALKAAEFRASSAEAELAAGKAELKTVLDREAATIERYDAKLDAVEAREQKLLVLLQQWENIGTHCSVTEGICCCGEDMDNHSSPMDCGHSPVDHGQYALEQTLEDTRAFLKAKR